jgi:hypothetical protein
LAAVIIAAVVAKYCNGNISDGIEIDVNKLGIRLVVLA